MGTFLYDPFQWRSLIAEQVTHIKERLLYQSICSQRERILSFKSNSLRYGNHFYHIRWASLSVTIFITHVRIQRNGSYANAFYIFIPFFTKLCRCFDMVLETCTCILYNQQIIWILFLDISVLQTTDVLTNGINVVQNWLFNGFVSYHKKLDRYIHSYINTRQLNAFMCFMHDTLEKPLWIACRVLSYFKTNRCNTKPYKRDTYIIILS